MKTKIYSITGEKGKEIDLPKFFSEKIRADLIWKVLEAKKTKQPYAPSPVAGKQHSASGVINHRRHVWKTHYGMGISRIPRKITSRRGTRFNWIGAEIPSVRGGRRAHPPKVEGMINTKKINKKEEKIALIGAISATANQKVIEKKYSSLEGKKIDAPFIVEGKITSLKSKEIKESLKKILGDASLVAFSEKKVRAGKGKMRGRKYKKNAGALLVVGKNEKIKTKIVDVKSAETVGITDLAKGGEGRLVVYTENAIKEIGERLK